MIDMKKILIFALSLLIMVGSFSATTFAAAVDETTGKTNYAFGVTNITFSGYYSDDDGSKKTQLTDGAYESSDYLGSNTNITTHVVRIDLGEAKYIDEVKLYHRTGGGKPYYTISVSTDGTNYTPVGTTGTYADNCTALSFTETKARYVRATFIDNKDMRTQLVEIEVWGTPRANIISSKSGYECNSSYTNYKWNQAFDGSLTTEAHPSTSSTAYCEAKFSDYYEIDKIVVYSNTSKSGISSAELRMTGLYKNNAVALLSATPTSETVSVDGKNYRKQTVNLPNGSIAKSVTILPDSGAYICEYEIYGKKVEAPTMGNITETADSVAGTTAVKLDVINGGESEITGRVYAAIYDENDMLSAVYKAANTVTVANGAYTTVDDIVLNAASGNLKLFLWTDTLIPLCAAK